MNGKNFGFEGGLSLTSFGFGQSGSTPPPGSYDLEMNFNSFPVANPTDVNEWNILFDLPANGTPFTYVNVSGTLVQLFNNGNIISLKNNLFASSSITTINDISGIVISVGSSFMNCSSLTSASLSAASIIGANAFLACSSLATFDFSSATMFGDYAFTGCSLITSISFASLTYIGQFCFYQCNLTYINLPALVTAGDFCFSQATNYYSGTLNLPSLTTAGVRSFENCMADNFDLPNLENAGDYCFTNPYSYIGVIYNMPKLLVANTGCFFSTKAYSYSFPLLEQVGSYCFGQCTYVTEFSFPSLVHLGPTVGNNSVFTGTFGHTILLIVAPAILTCQKGSADGDVEDLAANNTVLINPVPLTLVYDSYLNFPVATGSPVSAWNTWFNLPANGNPFIFVSYNGNTIKLYGGSNITIANNRFSYSHITEFKDLEGAVVSLGKGCFTYSYINRFEANGLTVIPGQDTVPFGEPTFSNSPNLSYVNCPNVTTIGSYAFFDSSNSNAINTFVFNFPFVTLIGSSAFGRIIQHQTDGFGALVHYTFYLPRLLNLGPTVGDDYVFVPWGVGPYITAIDLTIPSSLMTCNGGNPDGDISQLLINAPSTVITLINNTD